MDKKYWYFLAEIHLKNKEVVKYNGYTENYLGFFQISIAKMQAIARANIPVEEHPDGHRVNLLTDTFIVNQVNISETEYMMWKFANNIE